MHGYAISTQPNKQYDLLMVFTESLTVEAIQGIWTELMLHDWVRGPWSIEYMLQIYTPIYQWRPAQGFSLHPFHTSLPIP